ncbi:MAG TPA: hypothetical protein VF155_09210 [Candidatus Dormibacteraeota bacterium]
MARKTRRQKQRAATRQNAPLRSAAPRAGVDIAPSAPPPGGDDAEPDLDAAEAPLDAVVDEPAPQPAMRAAAPSPVGAAPAAARRRIERLSQAAPSQTRAGRPGKGPSNAAAMFAPLDSEDAAIPFDHVPYVPADLRRVLVIALCMVALIIVAAVVVTHVVH